jgi:DNA invertase Pin-like site-specific DNA recombinase
MAICGVSLPFESGEWEEVCNLLAQARSVTRQIEHARAYALARGWVVRDEYIFVDDGISGAEFRKRPGLTRLLNALRPARRFRYWS